MREIVLLELEPYWEAELCRRFGDLEGGVTVCRTVSEVRPALQRHPENLFLCHWHPIEGDLLLLIGETIEAKLTTGVIVLCKSGEEELEWTLREMGVVAVLMDRHESAEKLERYVRLSGEGKC